MGKDRNTDRAQKKTQENNEDTEPKAAPDSHKIGFAAILLITINSIMGTGIFFLPAVGAREAGLFSIFAWVIMGIIAVYYSTVFGELVSRFPKEGGVYEYAKRAFGNFPGFIIGWLTLIAANVTIAMLIVGAIMYLAPFIPGYALILISILFIIIFNYMAFRGLKTGVVMLVAFAFITLISVFSLLIPGLVNFNPANFTGWLTHSAFQGLGAGIPGIFAGASVIFFCVFFIAETFFGWETTSFLAEKVRNPRKVMPKTMVIATVFIAVCALLFVIASLSLIHWESFGFSLTPLTDLAAVVYGSGAVPVFSILVYLAIVGSVAGWIVAAPNLIVALAKDKLFIPHLSKIHPKTGTPYRAIIFQTVFTSILVVAGAGNYEVLLQFLVPLLLLIYASVVLALIFIRKKHPDSEHGFRAPFGSAGLWLLIIITLGLNVMWAFHADNALQIMGILLSFILFGFPIYLLLFFYYDPDASVKFKNQTALFSSVLERFFFPSRIKDEIMKNSDVRGKVVVELGAGTGLLSRAISSNKPDKHIIVEESDVLSRLIRKRLGARKEMIIINDPHLTSRIHPDIEFADEVFSFGILSNLNDIGAYLKQVSRLMPEHGRIHFFDYVDLYKFIPDKEILDKPDQLRRVFREAGFSARVIKRKGFLWNYLLINGIKSDSDEVYI